jgi:hypothetical protein
VTLTIDLTGRLFGRWRVISLSRCVPRVGRGANRLWLCECSCGTTRVVSGDLLRCGSAKSCGCLKREAQAARAYKHGHAKRGAVTSAYRVWTSMVSRCSDPKNERFNDYGGRGITVYVLWLIFENFYADMGDPPPGLVLDRIDNDGNYEPGNCRWATLSESNRNRRSPGPRSPEAVAKSWATRRAKRLAVIAEAHG